MKDITKPVTTENIAVLRFTRIPFGVISSQFVLAPTIIHHIIEKGAAFSKRIEKVAYVEVVNNWRLPEYFGVLGYFS